jgi:hypothetical protein
MRLRIVELCKEILLLQDECSDAVENSVDLISMLFNIADIPPAVSLCSVGDLSLSNLLYIFFHPHSTDYTKTQTANGDYRCSTQAQNGG